MTGIAAGGAELDAALNRFVARDGPGAVAGVVHGDELAWAAGAGLAEVGAQVTGDPGTLYRIASITKTFTGTAVMQLRDAGRLDLDDPAVKYLPELRGAVSPFAAIEAVTIRRMLSHESGLAAEPPRTDWSVPVYQGDPQLTLARPGDIVLMLPPNAQHKYSDLGYQLLGEIVTRVSGIPYPRYVRELILDPLGMSATGFEPLDGPLLSRRAAATAGGLSPMSCTWSRRSRRCGPRAACGHASRTWPGGSPSSCAPTPAGRGFAGSGRRLTAGDAQAPVPG